MRILAFMGLFRETKTQITDTRDAVLQTADDMQEIARAATATLTIIAAVALAALALAALALVRTVR